MGNANVLCGQITIRMLCVDKSHLKLFVLPGEDICSVVFRYVECDCDVSRRSQIKTMRSVEIGIRLVYFGYANLGHVFDCPRNGAPKYKQPTVYLSSKIQTITPKYLTRNIAVVFVYVSRTYLWQIW